MMTHPHDASEPDPMEQTFDVPDEGEPTLRVVDWPLPLPPIESLRRYATDAMRGNAEMDVRYD